MAEICNVSKKILRYYDENGIIRPAYRDESNNYRYYTENQIEEILLLQELRSLDFPVKVIGKLFKSRDLKAFETELERQLDELRIEMDKLWFKYDRTLELLLRTTRGRIAIGEEKRTRNAQIQRVCFHERTVAYTRYISYLNAKRLFISRRAELMKIINENKYESIGSNMAIFHSGYMQQFSDRKEDECGDLEVLIEVKNGNLEKHCRVIKEFDAVSGIYIGPYKKMKSFYEELERYAYENNIEIQNVSIEEYLVGATMTDNQENYVTRIYIPLKKQEKSKKEKERKEDYGRIKYDFKRPNAMGDGITTDYCNPFDGDHVHEKGVRGFYACKCSERRL